MNIHIVLAFSLQNEMRQEKMSLLYTYCILYILLLYYVLMCMLHKTI